MIEKNGEFQKELGVSRVFQRNSKRKWLRSAEFFSILKLPLLEMSKMNWCDNSTVVTNIVLLVLVQIFIQNSLV